MHIIISVAGKKGKLKPCIVDATFCKHNGEGSETTERMRVLELCSFSGGDGLENAPCAQAQYWDSSLRYFHNIKQQKYVCEVFHF